MTAFCESRAATKSASAATARFTSGAIRRLDTIWARSSLDNESFYTKVASDSDAVKKLSRKA